MKNTALPIFLICSMFPMTSAAQDSNTNKSIGVDLVSEYVFRGTSLGQNSVQPFIEYSRGNFTVGTWGSTGIGENSDLSADEVDIYASYAVKVNEGISLDFGATYYYYPQSGAFLETDGGTAGSYEFSANINFNNVPLEPSVTSYYDVTLEAFTLEGAIAKSLPLSDDFSLDLSGTAGLVDASNGGGYQWGQAGLALSYAVGESSSLYFGGNFVANSESNTLDLNELNNAALTASRLEATDSNLLWVGTGISTNF